jgi:cob(I)alamin adenosyltransferase
MAETVRGLLVIFTGDGKGKTTAALGTVFRALGHGFKCRIIQFIKGTMDTGELHSAAEFGEMLEIIRVGEGFTWDRSVPREKHEEAAKEGLEIAADSLESGGWRVVVLDEILYALGAKLVALEDIKSIIRKKPADVHLILTGRGAPPELIDLADMVSEIRAVKHPFEKGIPAQKGVDF